PRVARHALDLGELRVDADDRQAVLRVAAQHLVAVLGAVARRADHGERADAEEARDLRGTVPHGAHATRRAAGVRGQSPAKRHGGRRFGTGPVPSAARSTAIGIEFWRSTSSWNSRSVM